MNDVKKYRFRGFDAEGAQITKENFEEIAKWAGGLVQDTSQYMPGTNRQFVLFMSWSQNGPTKVAAYEGDWIVKVGENFKLVPEVDFLTEFEEVPEDRRKELEENIRTLLSLYPDAPPAETEARVNYWIGRFERLFQSEQ